LEPITANDGQELASQLIQKKLDDIPDLVHARSRVHNVDEDYKELSQEEIVQRKHGSGF
jgi:hypothetical protein